MILETVRVGELDVNCYILALSDNSPAVIIDPGDNIDRIKRILEKHKLKPTAVINTHGHIDHIGCDDEFDLPVYAHNNEIAILKSSILNLSGFLSRPLSVKSNIKGLNDRDKFSLAGIDMEVIHTPGHTAGGICLLIKNKPADILISGDSLFRGSIGRSDFPGADGGLLIKSIKEKLFALNDNTEVYPGHGAPTTIGYEKKHNPFLR